MAAPTRALTRFRHGVFLLLPLLLFWYALTGGRGLAAGVAAAAASAALAAVTTNPPRARLSGPGTLRFVLHFMHRSVAGGVDVARRALAPGMPLEGGEGWRELALPAGPPRHLYEATACLLPGTLICRDSGRRVWVHSISGDAGRTLDDLESAVRTMFSLQDQDRGEPS